MNKRQIIQHARNYMDLLSRGEDPIHPGEADRTGALDEPRLRRCFAFVSGILEEILTNDGLVDLGEGASQYTYVRKKAAFHMEAEQKRRVYISKQPVTPNVFVLNINRTVDTGSMEKLSIRQINAWLTANHYVTEEKQLATMQKTVYRPTEKAMALGMREMEVTDPNTGEIKTRLMLSGDAQAYLLDNLESIIGETPK